ncbi:MAG: PAS domain S-box protein [Desulfobacteraceae bacterium]|nr:PAS domain S-box protein [Desulfobacteraceae bacterium]
MERLNNLSLKNKIFFFNFATILILSVGIALVARWVFVSSILSRHEKRGIDIAQSIAESGRGHILTENTPELTSLITDAAQLGERKILISYIYILDKEERVLSHTFIDVYRDELLRVNKIPPQQPHSIKLLQMGGESAYDIALPIKDGIYKIGTVHVGLNKRHIDKLIGKLRFTFLGFISAIAIIFFGISHWLSRYITRPMSQLTRVSDEISRGNLDIKPAIGTEIKCWEMKKCGEVDCPAYNNNNIPCWYIDETLKCGAGLSGEFHEKREVCHECDVYQKYAGDEVVQLARAIRNMTIRIKSSENELKESEEQYRSLFNSGPNPIFVLDRETLEILDANPRAEEAYGYSKEELTGKPFTDLGTFEYKDEYLLYVAKDDWPKGYAITQKVRHLKKGNKPFYVNVYSCLIKYKEIDAIILSTTDITEMIEKDAQLVQAGKMTSLGEMSAGIAHELNQPLNTIKMGNEFLKMMIEEGRKIPEEDLSQVVNEASDQVDRAAEIINRLREFGRKADFTKEKININKPINGVIDIIGQQLRLQNIELELDLDETIPPILAHNNRLEQVIFNMVTNAQDAINQKKAAGTESGNRVINIRSSVEGDRVAVTFSDTGIGIPMDDKDRIFEPFFTTKEVGKGMGLGLSIAYGIVRDYGGAIHVESREGGGTTFNLTFPCAPE